MKKKSIFSVVISTMTLAATLVACTSKAPVKEQQPANETKTKAPDNALVVAADNHLKTHQEDISALWEDVVGQEKEMAKYALVNGDVFLTTSDGKEGLLLYFYKDMKDIDNFDGIGVNASQTLSLQGDALVLNEKTDAGDKTTYYERTEHEGFNELFTVTEKDGKKTYTNDLNEPYDEKKAQDFIDNKISKARAVTLAEILSEWVEL